VAVALAVVVSPWASSSPDGLERVAQDEDFLETGRLHPVQERSPVPDYAFPGVKDARAATGLAGLVGTLAVVALALGLGALLRRGRGARRGPPSPGPASP
jgi:hypothetical protein